MPLHPPTHCRRRAYDLFTTQLPQVDTTAGLIAMATAVSLHELDEVDPQSVPQTITRLAQRIRARCRSGNALALLSHAHEVLFEEEGFVGNFADYYHPHNSYLPRVLSSRVGLPITLALLYKAVLEEAGLPVAGVNAPGHFLASVRVDQQTMLIDPFHGGQLLSADEARARIEAVVGTLLPDNAQLFAPATHRQWLMRLLQNLITVLRNHGRTDDMAAMLELQRLL